MPLRHDRPRQLVLGEPLDQMLNAECRYPFQFANTSSECPHHGGIILPTPSDPGTGNIVIRGRAGTGKSTLALQIAAEAARRNDGIYAAYLSLEESQQQVFRKARNCGWSAYVWPLNRTFPAEHGSSIDQLAGDLASILDQPMLCHTYGQEKSIAERGVTCPAARAPWFPCPFLDRCRTAKDDIETAAKGQFTAFPGKVILPQVEPRAFSPDLPGAPEDSLFWTRYRQLDRLLHAARELRNLASKNQQNEPALRAGESAAGKVAVLSRAYAVLNEGIAGIADRILACATCRQKTTESCQRYAGHFERAWLGIGGEMALLLKAITEARKPTDRDEQESHSKLNHAIHVVAQLLAKNGIWAKPCGSDNYHRTQHLMREMCAELHRGHWTFLPLSESLATRTQTTSLLQVARVPSSLARRRRLLCRRVSALRSGTNPTARHSRQRAIGRRAMRLRHGPAGKSRRAPFPKAGRFSSRGQSLQAIAETGLLPTGTSSARTSPFCRLYRWDQGKEHVNPVARLWPSGPFDKSLAVVCVDSLNVLGAGGLTRDHLAALFDLFKRRQVIGVFVVEENERGMFAGDSPIDSDTIDFLADMVIELTATEEQGYYVRHFQVAKSRYQKHTLGKHPYKIEGVTT